MNVDRTAPIVLPLTIICFVAVSAPALTFESSDLSDSEDSISYNIAPVGVLNRSQSSKRPVLVDPERGKKHSNDEVNFSTIDHGAVSGISTSERLSIKDQTTWIEVWKKHAEGRRVPQVVPHVDFDKKMVLAVFEGEKSGNGEMVRIERVRLFKDKMVVLLGHEHIGSGSTRSTLRSFHIVSLPRTNLPVVFH